MTTSDNLRRKSALLLSSTMGLALALAGCTSVEVADKTEIHSPKIAAAAATPQAAPGTPEASAQPQTQQAVAATAATPAAGPTGAPVEVASNAAVTPLPSAAAVKGGRVALPPAAEIAAAAAISAQTQQPETQQIASVTTDASLGATPVAATAMTTTSAAGLHAAANTSGTASLPQVVAVKGSFPPAPPPPGTPSSAPVQLTEEMVREQTIVPLRKPEGTMLAYASAPQNAALAAISTREGLTTAPEGPQPVGREKLSGLISKYATMYHVPEDLVHRVVMRESRYNPAAYNGGHFGLMQIKHATARSMGFNGPANGLFDAETNLKYAVKYLSGAWKVAENDRDGAVRLYARGYYYDAKRKGMLHVLRQ
ncbi:lytic transglycosylase domain-containing protein [Agrobacterium larrymoorei]|uniref:Lytic transglycosylase domain-containing protein n=1 Tax=Agrobacterium larrymoorei TaxID=160699 RepID=A0A4D7DT34_9HYPH|nr:lytic transglycosylase domain-containing protein [Agrobacterium larrymoorei]QCI97409.1 lytic transglycosylase domain-containing protein [Agrobacterium larrymoorei]QYA07155.1 lytic transglycosylase domain-containing protein [Agrobacterium larrymoorei]